MHAWSSIRRADAAIAGTRSAWGWLGHAALGVLGIHLACDALDDHVLAVLQALPLGWQSPVEAAVPAAWTAVALELALSAWLLLRLWGALTHPPATWTTWRTRLALRDLTRAAFWIPVALAGAWVIGMAVEDLAAPVHPWLGAGLGTLTAVLVAWRLGWTGLRAIVGGPPAPRWWSGWPMAVPLLGTAALALGALPVWGWWP